jgi:hypothetical protein
MVAPTATPMMGNSGNDIYVVDDAADVVTEYADEGTDTVNAYDQLYARRRTWKT